MKHRRYRNFPRNNGRGIRRGRCGNGNNNSAGRGNNNNGGYTLTNLNRNLYENICTGGERGRVRGNQVRGGRGRGNNDGKNGHGHCSYCLDFMDHGWHDCSLRHAKQLINEIKQAITAPVSPAEACSSHASCTSTENADTSIFQVIVGDGVKPPSHVKFQEDTACPAVTKIGTSTHPPGTQQYRAIS